MLEERCDTTDASITIFENEFVNDLVSWKQEYSKLMQVLLLKRWAKKGVMRCGQVKNCCIA